MGRRSGRAGGGVSWMPGARPAQQQRLNIFPLSLSLSLSLSLARYECNVQLLYIPTPLAIKQTIAVCVYLGDATQNYNSISLSRHPSSLL
jgi:hypothetical protein